MKYKISIDYGKPYDVECNSEEEVRAELEKVRVIVSDGDYAYCDVVIHDENDKDVADKFMDGGIEY